MKSITQLLRRLFGISSESQDTEVDSRESEITVEREPDTTSEDAVKGTEETAEAETPAEHTESVATETGGDDETDAAESAEDVDDSDAGESVEDAKGSEAETAAADDSEAETAAADDAADGIDDAEPEETVEEAGDESAVDETAEAASVSDDPVDEINGIGPTYSERLGEIGIETVGDLVAGDADAVAEAAQVSEKRASEWIEKAENYA